MRNVVWSLLENIAQGFYYDLSYGDDDLSIF